MSERELAQGFGFNLTAAPVPDEPLEGPKDESGEAKGASPERESTYCEASRRSNPKAKPDSRGGSQSLCGKPRRMGVRQGQRGAAGKHGCSLAAPDSQGDELHRDPFFSSKHKLKEIWRPRKRSILLMGGDF